MEVPLRVDEKTEHGTQWHVLLVERARTRPEQHGAQAKAALETATRA
ncbi:hypothetical protein [Streptomyces canus]|nr:hypothetical protein [Streptomyces canus]